MSVAAPSVAATGYARVSSPDAGAPRSGEDPKTPLVRTDRRSRIPRARIDKTPRALVIYASTHGNSAKVAARIAEALREECGEVDLLDVLKSADADPGAYDVVVAGGSLHLGKHQRELVDWAKANRDALTDRPSAFFSVSLTAADGAEEAHEATQQCIDDFVKETGWTPARTMPIAGALQYREYDVFTRTLMRLKMRSGGHPTDPSHDHEYTDWDSVERFGHECAELAVAQA